MGAFQDQLLKHEHAEIRQVSHESYVQDASIKPQLARLWDYRETQKAFGLTDEGIDRILAAACPRYPGWSREQVLVALAIDGLGGAANPDLGILRRIVRDDPAELAVGVGLGARIEWLRRRP